MANQIRYSVGFDVQQGNLNQLKASLQQISKLKIGDIMKINDTDAASASSALNKIKQEASNVEKALKAAFNTKLNTVNIEEFNQSLKGAGSNINSVYQAFRSAGTAGQNAFRSLSSSILSTNIQLKETHNLLDKMATTLTNTIKWNMASSAVNMMTRSVEQAWGYVKSLDTSLNDIRIVTGKSADEMANFAIKANEAAQSLGKSTTDYTNAALIYAQQGLSDREIEERTAITLKTANVTGQSTADVSEQLTAVWNGYKVNAEEAELYVDRLAAVAATTASDLEELSTGMSKVASAAATMGVGEEQLAAQLSTIISVTRQAPESIGAALRTIYARISDIKAGISEDGVTLGNYTGKMAELGFNVLDATGNLRDMDEVIEEIGGRWGDLTREQQISLAQTMAGQRQFSYLISLFDNFEKYNEALNTAQNAAGTLQEQQDIYMESTRAHLETLGAAVENIYDSFADTDTINSLIDALTSVTNLGANFVDSIGGGAAVLRALGSVGVTVFSQQIARGINTTITNFEIAKENARQFDQALQATKEWQGIPELEKTSQDLLKNREQLLQLSRLMTPEQFTGMQTLLNDITTLGNEIQGIQSKLEPLENTLKDFTDTSLIDVLGNEKEIDNIINKIDDPIDSLEKLQQKVKDTKEVFRDSFGEANALLGKSGVNTFDEVFDEAQIKITSFLDTLHDLRETDAFQGAADKMGPEIDNIENEWKDLIKTIDSTKPEESSQALKAFFDKLYQVVGTSSDEIKRKYEELLGVLNDPTIVTSFEQKQQQLNKMVNDFVTGQERMQRAAKIENYAKMAGGIAQVGSAIQQVQNLGSIWKNSDLSTSEKVLQTVTNLAFSLPMLTAGFKTAATALGLMNIVTGEQAVAAFSAAAANTTHSLSLGKLSLAASKSTIAVRILNTTIMLNPYVAAAAAVLALVAALGALIKRADEANEAAIEANKAAIETANQQQEEIEKNKQLYSSIEELNEKYKEGEISRSELKTEVESLISQYELEGAAADKLRASYDDLGTAIKEARTTMANEGRKSAAAELDEAQGLVRNTARGKVRDNGVIANGRYQVSFDTGVSRNDESQAIQQAIINAGGKNFTFESASDSAADIVALYEQISSVVEDIRDKTTETERNNSELFQGMVDWLKQMEDAVNAYKDALNDVEQYSVDFANLTKEGFNLDNVSSISQYIAQRNKLIEESGDILQKYGDSSKNAAQLADQYLQTNYTDLYNQFNELTKYAEQLQKKLGDDVPSDIVDKVGQLSEEQIAELIQIPESALTSWADLRDYIEDIASKDLSNLEPIEKSALDLQQEAASEQYGIYQSLEDQVRGGKTISSKQLEGLNPQLQEFFSMMANGSYKMTGDAKEFYETVNNFKLNGFHETLATIESELNQINQLSGKNFDYNALSESAITSPSDATSVYGNNRTTDYDLVNQQLEYLRIVGETNDVLQTSVNHWQEQVDKQQLSIQAAQEIAKAVEDAGDKTQDLGGRSEELTQKAEELAHQLHDAMFPTDADIDETVLESLSETLQEIAPQAEGLADSLSKDARAAEDVAESILRFDDAIQDVVDNYDDWLAALNSGSVQEQAEVINDLRDAYADLLDLDGSELSDDFLTDADNLELMKAAIDGDIDAYDELLSRAGQDIAAQVHLDTTQFQNEFDYLMDLYYQGQNLDDMEIGAELNNEGFLAGLSQMITAAGMTAQQATDYLASMGVDAEVIEQKTEGTETKQITGYHGEPNNTQIPYDFVYLNGTNLQHYTGSITAPGVNYVPDTETVTDTKESSAFSLKVTSAHKSSGGGFKFSQAKNGGGSAGKSRRSGSGGKGGGGKKGGGGSGKSAEPDTSQKDLKKPLEDERDIYHDINIELQQINRELDRTQEKQDRLYGKQLLDNLNKQTAILEAHKDKLKEKHKLQEQDLANQQKILSSLGVTFDTYGNISNYMSILANKQAEVNGLINEYNGLINIYNASTDKDAKKAMQDTIDAKSKEVKNAQDSLKDLQDKIKDYDSLREDMEDVVDEIQEETQKQIEINIQKFRMEVEIRLDMGEAERDWNEFRRKVLEHTDIIKDTDFSSIFRDAAQEMNDLTSYFNVHGSVGSLEVLTNQLLNTRAEIEAINETGTSAIYGDNKAQAMEDLQNDLDELMSQMEDIEDLIDEIDKAYLETIDDIADQFDKQIEDYEYVGQLIEHDIDLLQLLYGDRNYQAMNEYYTQLEQNNLKVLDSLKQQRDFWKEQWDAAVARGDTNAAKEFEEHYKETIKNLNKTVEDAAKTLQEKYVNAIDRIFDELDKKITNGLGTDYLSAQWDLMNKNADEYLDTINSAFAIQDLDTKFKDAINGTDSIKGQQRLKKLMDEQLENLKTKDKLTQYDVDRAEKLLQIEQARIALEDAQASKTSMRLKRDSQGNYSYEYVADQGNIAEAKNGLAAAQNDLYNFDKERYQSNLDDMLAAWKDFQADYKDIINDMSLTEEERVARLALLREEYGEYINNKTAENLVIRNNLMESAFNDIALMYDTDVANYNAMSEEEKNILMGDLVPTWKSGIQEMTDKVAGEGGFIPICEDAFEELDEVTKDYQEELNDLADTAGVNLDDIRNGVDTLADEFSILVEANDDLLDRMGSEITAIQMLRGQAQALVNDYIDVYNAAIDAVSQLHNFIQAEQAAAAAYQATASAYENMIYRMQRANANYVSNPTGGGSNYSSSSSSGGSGGSDGGSGSGSGSGNSNKSNSSSTASVDPKKRKTGHGCFSAGTKIIMADNTIKNIEDVQVNEIVIAFNDETMSYEPRKVTKTFIHSAIDLVQVTLSNGVTMSMTPGHPLLTTKGWKSLDIENSLYEHGVVASLLNLGDRVLGYHGNALVIAIKWVNIPDDYVVYNLEVEYCHTYLANGMVVHNEKRALPVAFEGGGYTGDWDSDDGKIAILHKRELVLNQQDTKNLLDSVSILRQITTNLGGTLTNRMGDINIKSILGNDIESKDELEQNVNISATFPNVDSKREIEEAFNELVNLAAQRALR